MITWIQQIDTQVFLFLNGMHNPFFDWLMYWVSTRWIWVPLYVFLLYLVIRQYRWKSLIVLLAIAILITLSDQLSVLIFKDNVQRLRPCHNPDIVDNVHLVRDYCGGMYGFISSHAANSFALAIFLTGLLGKRYRYFTVLILLWALLISYSRVYLGVHYPGDVLAGALFGSVLGLMITFTTRKILDTL